MRISLVQSEIKWLDVAHNLAVAERYLSLCEGSGLVIFSEMFTTGFCTDPTLGADREGQVLEWMQREAAQRQIAIAGGVAVREAERCFNRLYFVRSDGTFEYYDKRHLFSFAAEDKHYEAGERRVVVEVLGVRILLSTCYDLRFPVWLRNRGDYDVMVCVAAWPASRRKAWDTLLRARAIENLSYVCGVNIVGEDMSCSYSGGTAAIDFKGCDVASVADNEQGVATFEVDMVALRSFREKFPAMDDMDEFEIKNINTIENKQQLIYEFRE